MTPRTRDYPRPFVGPPFLYTQRPAADDRGKLLIEEGQDDLRKTSEAYLRRGLYLIAYGGLLVGLIVFNFVIGLTQILLFMSMLLFMASSLSFASGATLIFASGKVQPLRIFERGIEGTALVGTKTFYFPFSEITSVTERSGSVDGQVFIFRTANLGQSIAIRKRMSNFAEALKVIRSELVHGKSSVKWDVSPDEGVTSRRAEYGLYATATVVGVVVSVVFILFMFPGQPLSFMVSGLKMMMPIFVMLSVTYMTYRMMGMHKRVPRRLDVRIPAVMIAGTLALSFISIGLDAATSAPSPSPYAVYIEPKPASSSLAPGIYVNATLSVDDWILVDAGQILQLVNTSISMNLSADKGFGIWVADGGILNITEGSEILSSNPALGYTFEINGSAKIDDSTISGIWADPKSENFNGGLEIYSSDVVINATKLPDARINGILVMYSSPTIANSTISNAGDDGIEMHGSGAHIIGNTINNCGYAMIIADGSDALIEGNLFFDNQHGVAVQTSDPVIRSNRFQHNYNYAISYDSASHMILEDNQFINNEVDTVESSGLYIIAACGIITVGLAAVCFVILFWIRKEQLRAEQERRDRSGQLKGL